MIVVDASAVFDVLILDDPIAELNELIATADELAAPHVIDLELLQALRRSIRTGKLGFDRAADARMDLDDLPLIRFGHRPLADRIWRLRDQLSAYDASYLALAEELSVPLITRDSAFASVSDRFAEVIFY